MFWSTLWYKVLCIFLFLSWFRILLFSISLQISFDHRKSKGIACISYYCVLSHSPSPLAPPLLLPILKDLRARVWWFTLQRLAGRRHGGCKLLCPAFLLAFKAHCAHYSGSALCCCTILIKGGWSLEAKQPWVTLSYYNLYFSQFSRLFILTFL